MSSSFGNFHPSIGQLLSSDIYTFNASVNQSILTANKVFRNFLNSEAGKVFEECGDGGEIFVIGDYIGGIIMYEALAKSKNNEVNNFDYNVDNTSNYRTHRLHSHSSSPSVNKNSSSNSRSKSPMFTSSVQLSPLSSGKQGNNSKEVCFI